MSANPSPSPSQGWTSSWLENLSCPVSSCASHGTSQPQPLQLWGELGHWPGLRCPHCQTVWPDATVVLRKQLPWKTPLWGAIASGFATLGVWLLPWPLALKIAALVLGAWSLFAAFKKMRQINDRLDACRLMILLGEPAGPEDGPWDIRLLDQLKDLELPERQPALQREIRQLADQLKIRGLPLWRTLRHLQLQMRPSSLRQILQLAKKARMSDHERALALSRASWLQDVCLHEHKLSQGLIDLEEIVPSLFDLLQEWILHPSEGPSLEEIRASVREGKKLLDTLEDLLSPLEEPSSSPLAAKKE